MDPSNLLYLINWQPICISTVLFSVENVEYNADNFLLLLTKIRKKFFLQINRAMSNKPANYQTEMTMYNFFNLSSLFL